MFNRTYLKNISLDKTFFTKLIGNNEVFSLESRIFHGISIGLIALSLVYIPYNFFAGLYTSAFSTIIFLLFYLHQFYYSRFKAKQHNSLIFGLIGIGVFSANFFSNSGIDGSTDLIWPAYLLIVFAVSPYKQHVIWLVIYLLCFTCLHFIGYLYPSLVSHPFDAGKGQFIDRVTAFPLPVVVIYIIIHFIRKSHDREREIIEEKKIAIEKKQAVIELQNEQLAQSNVEKNRLMSIISHDLRAPLVNIKSYLDLLTANEVENHERPLLENALHMSTANALELLTNLLQWSKSQMSGVNLKLTKLNLLTSLFSTLEMERQISLKKGISLSYAIAEDIFVYADVDMLQLIVRNLINNAIKFTPTGGSILIEAELMETQCKIIVKDNGNGIAEHKQKEIFAIQGHTTYGTNNEKGVGLGLVLCKEYVELQNGSIGFESNLGIGSSFYILIPIDSHPIF